MSNSGSPRPDTQETKEASSTSTDQAQPQPPPPPPPSAFPFVPPPVDIKPSVPSGSSTSSKPVWPDGFLLFLDPLSPSAIPKLVQNLATLTNGHPPRQTAVLSEATHIVIDPHSPFGDAVLQLQARQQPPSSSSSPRPFLVTDQWLKQCILWSNWEDEQDFLFTKAREIIERRKGGGGGGREQDVKMKEPEEEEESAEEGRKSGKVSKLPNLPTSGRWLESEDDALARFLLPLEDYNTKDQNGRDAFERFARTEFTRRSGGACREHHRGRKDEFNARMDALRGGSGVGTTRSGDGKGKGKERAREESSSESDSSDESGDDMERKTGGGVGSGIRVPYSTQEEDNFRRCLKENSTIKAAARAMSALHPRRTVASCSTRYHKRRESYKHLLGTELAVGTEDVDDASSNRWTTSEDDQLIRLLAEPFEVLKDVYEAFQAQNPDRTLMAIATRYHSQKTRFRHAAQLLKSSSSSSAPRRSSIAFGSNSNPPHQHHPSPPPRSLDINSPSLPPSPTSSSSSSSSSGFEPPSFLSPGVAPSSLPPSAPFCYWCGTGEDESEYFKMLELAEEDPSDAEEITKVDGRLACSFCVVRTERWSARGDGGEMGDLERLAWLGRKLEVKGRTERATLVRMRDGGTAEED